VKLKERWLYALSEFQMSDKYRVYQNDWSGFEVDYIHKYGEQNYKY
jgi:hypothetical protein